jgi:hypothetical protein
MKKTNTFWEVLNYIALALCVFGQMAVGYVYLIAQFGYLIANSIAVIRDIKLKLPTSNTVKDFCFLSITIGLIVIRLVVG